MDLAEAHRRGSLPDLLNYSLTDHREDREYYQPLITQNPRISAGACAKISELSDETSQAKSIRWSLVQVQYTIHFKKVQATRVGGGWPGGFKG